MEEDDTINNAVFSALKPICDSIVLDANPTNICELNNIVTRLPTGAIFKFQSYICFPIEIQLLKNSNAKINQMLVDLLTKVIRVSSIGSLSMLLRLSTLLVQQIIAPDQTLVDCQSEELKLSVVKCLDQTWKSAMSDVLYNVYTREYYPKLTPVIFMLIQIAKSEKYFKLRVSALECVLTICQIDDSVDTSDIELRQRVQNVVMLMLPGIVSCCVGISADPSLINHNVAVANIRVWSRTVSLVMEDGEITSESDAIVPSSPSTLSERVQQMQRAERTADWLRETATRLTTVTEAMLRLQTHDHWQIRRQLALAAKLVLNSCQRNMASSVGPLVCSLLVLSEDSQQEVSEAAGQALVELSRQFEQDEGQPLLELVEATFYNLLSRAPRIIRSADESGQLSCLNLLVGCLRLQGPRLPQVLASAAFLNKLLLTMLHIVSLDCSHISLLEDCSIKEVDNTSVTCDSWKQLMYCNSPQSLHKLQDTCAVLRTYADLQTITHALIDYLDSSPELTKEVILMLNLILAGGGTNSMSEDQQAELVLTVASVYLQSRLWDIPFSLTQSNSAANMVQARSNIVQVALLAEGLGMFSVAIGAHHFSAFLLRCLYPLLECAGSPLQPLSLAGLAAVQRVAQSCVAGGVTDLVRGNVDYLSHHITMRLRRAQQNPGVLSVLSVVMRHTTVQVLPSLHEIVEDVLVQSCDEFQESNAGGFLRVFLTFLECLRGWQSQAVQDANPPEVKLKPLIEELLEYKNAVEAANNFDDEDAPIQSEITKEMFQNEVTKDEEEEFKPEEKPKQVDPTVKLTVAVLERSLNFLPSKDEQRQILVLDILREGVLVLKKDEDQLLPVVHKIWGPLVNRFKRPLTSPLIMHRAFLLLCTLGQTSKEFIRSRTLKEVVPALCETLKASARLSLMKDSGAAYRLTQQYKLQRTLLSGLGQLATDLSLLEKDLYQLLNAANPYLSSKQPLPLQELCCLLYRDVAVSYPSLVWIQLVSLWSPTAQFNPPSTHFRSIYIDTCCDDSSEFKKNVRELLSSLDS